MQLSPRNSPTTHETELVPYDELGLQRMDKDVNGPNASEPPSYMAPEPQDVHAAAERGDVESLKILLKQKANVDVQNQEGATPLMTAAAAGHVEVAQCLMAARADVWHKDQNGLTAMQRATVHCHEELVELLRDEGAEMSGMHNSICLYWLSRVLGIFLGLILIGGFVLGLVYGVVLAKSGDEHLMATGGEGADP